ncbi:hypothetical protein LEP1GSC047_1218 [Leptospira inadai serovar Lyme str. 10]|uniref:Uncharacterized protein n=2 Tax=Leptospira inadai serovar Lyme TaxID=293084 RepID=V6HR47_9LEPT|nr:hypothetical protein LEP1GSC047_1218 [Leptospira inadai serovar Lyme str. 10]PNV75961.1 hypothetical protein BES34_005485 [Leptospira inadai serovar Lyme]
MQNAVKDKGIISRKIRSRPKSVPAFFITLRKEISKFILLFEVSLLPLLNGCFIQQRMSGSCEDISPKQKRFQKKPHPLTLVGDSAS